MLGLIVNIICIAIWYHNANEEIKGKDRLWVLLMLSFFGILSFFNTILYIHQLCTQ